jgi:hypothetical protein
MALKVSASDGVKVRSSATRARAARRRRRRLSPPPAAAAAAHLPPALSPQVYTVAGGKNVPAWLSEQKKKSLRKDEDFRRRVELLQDFHFPAACTRVKFTPDGSHIFASGLHPPRVRVFDLAQLSMKFERHLDSEVIDFQILGEDYSKAAFLCDDRSLRFHARFGAYYKLRVPRAGRDLAFAPHTAELFVAGSAPEIWRLSLGEGRFGAPLPTRAPGVNALGLSPAHGLLAAAGEDGGLECFDPRARAPLGRLAAAAAAGGAGQALTAARFDDAGLRVAVGTSGGLVALFDLRSSRPLVVKDHMCAYIYFIIYCTIYYLFPVASPSSCCAEYDPMNLTLSFLPFFQGTTRRSWTSSGTRRPAAARLVAVRPSLSPPTGARSRSGTPPRARGTPPSSRPRART